MLIVGFIFATAAAAFHVVVFALESLRWTAPRTRKIFRVASEADAVTMRQLAFNQGFYNLFLALATLLGIGLTITGATIVGLTLVYTGTGMMLAAALVLVLSNRRMLRAAALQGTLPLLAIVATAAGSAVR